MPLPLLAVVGVAVAVATLSLLVVELWLDEVVALLELVALSAVLDELEGLPAYDAAAT